MANVPGEHSTENRIVLLRDYVMQDRVGILLINLGTPEATDYWSVRRYLSEFLSDPRVIELPKVLWQPLLQAVVLALRPIKSGKSYASIWNRRQNESPLKTFTREQADGLRAQLKPHLNGQIMVDWAMRYGEPAIGPAVERLKAKGCSRILLFPLYPQYSATTTATACDAAFRQLMRMRWQPAVRVVPSYYGDTQYIEALAEAVEGHVGQLDWQPDLLLLSYHGLPERYVNAGDPYYAQCAATTRLLAARLGWPAERVRMSFQSRFGRAEWVKPYTADLVESLPERGVKRICVMAPGFAADCIETLDELAVEVRDRFMAAGGKAFSYIPCLNHRDSHINALAAIIERELSGWL